MGRCRIVKSSGRWFRRGTCEDADRHPIPVSDVETARKIIRVMSAIEDNDDVQDVFANFDMADELLEEAAE